MPRSCRRVGFRRAMRRTAQERRDDGDRPAKATFAPGDYGRIVSPDGTEQWWVRSSKGTWIALRHRRGVGNAGRRSTPLFLAGQSPWRAADVVARVMDLEAAKAGGPPLPTRRRRG